MNQASLRRGWIRFSAKQIAHIGAAVTGWQLGTGVIAVNDRFDELRQPSAWMPKGIQGGRTMIVRAYLDRRLAQSQWRYRAVVGHSRAVIVIQRVRMRWGAHARGSVQAGLRSRLPDAFTLATFEPADAVVHEVLLDEPDSYQSASSIEYGKSAARTAGIWLEADSDGALTIDRLPGWQAYPIQRRPQRLFTLHNGQIGRCRANFRFTGCACAPQWYYEQWTTHIFNGARPGHEVFVNGQPHHDVDLRVHLYGGRRRVSRKAP